MTFLNAPKFAFKKVLPVAVPVAFLNFFFLWTSQLLVLFQTPTGHGIAGNVNRLIGWAVAYGIYYPSQSRLIPPRLSGLIMVDLIAVSCLAILFIVSAKLFSLFRAIQISSVVVMTLPIEIYFGDPGQFNIWVTTSQITYNILPWFTNADLLYAMLFVFVGTIFWSIMKGMVGKPSVFSGTKQRHIER